MGFEIFGLLGAAIVGILSLLWLLIVIWAIIKTAKSSAGPVAMVLWILILIAFPVFGLIAWLLLGPKR